LLALTGAGVMIASASFRSATQLARGQPTPVAAAEFAYQGTATCAAAACHNGNGPAGSRGSEYSTWAARDPHARAHEVLRNERSRRMVLALNQTATEVKPENDARCTGCHVLPDF